ncbi:serine hydrolase [Methylobacterium sp. A54F]
MATRIVLLLILLLASGASRAGDPPGYADRAEALIAPYRDAGLFSGAVLVAHRGEPVFRAAYGLANREWSIPNAPETRFRVGSITKQFTAAAILQLAEAGRLGLDDPVGRYYAEAPATWGAVTIRMLLTHSSGIPSYTNLPDYYARIQRIEMSPRAIVGLTADRPLLFPPGTAFDYDNTGYVLLGLVIEAASGLPFDRYVRERILDPLGMTETGYDDAGAILPRRASGYRHAGGGWRNAAPLASSIPYAAGGFYSTVDDLNAWDRALFSGRVVGPASLDAMFHDAGHGYGLGWYIGTANRHRLWSHGGNLAGFLTIKDRYPDDDLTVLVLANTETAPAQTIARALAALWFGVDEAETAVVLEPEIMDRYAGSYRLDNGALLTLARDGGVLIARTGSEVGTPFRPESDRTFVSPLTGARITLETEPEGAPTGLVLHREGAEQVGTRIGEADARALAEATERRRAVTPDFAFLDRLCGRYRVGAGGEIAVTREGGRLFAQRAGEARVELVPQGSGRYLLRLSGTQVSFAIAAGGASTGLVLHQDGHDTAAARLPAAEH